MRVLVAGASGFVGRHLVRALLARGDEVAVLTRSAAATHEVLPRECRLLEWREGERGAWYEEVGRVDAVVNLAGASVFGRWTEAHKARVRASRVQSTRALVEAIAAAGDSQAPDGGRPKVLVNASGTGFYGASPEGRLDECAPAGDDFLASVCVEWEGEAERAEALGVRVVRLRLGVVVGPGEGAVKEMIAPLRLFVAGPIGKGDNFVSWVHVDDAVGMILWAIDDAAVSGPLNCTSPHCVTAKEMAHGIASVLGRPAIRVPELAARMLFGEAIDAVTGSQEIYPQRAIDAGYEFRHARIHSALEAALMAE